MNKADPNKQGWEQSEFPILCETCLGESPYMRMTKQDHGRECKICTRPFTIFRWCPGKNMRFKKTEICQSCAKLKNTCQTCMLDLEFGLPVQVRDSILQVKEAAPQSDVNREYFMQNAEKQLENGASYHDYSKADSAARETLKRMARREPYYKRNRAHLCSFFVKGECTRGETCPYRHEMPEENNELSKQNIKDRYYGNNDPVAKKYLARLGDRAQLKSPDDPTVTTLFLTGITEEVTKEDLEQKFYIYGELKSVVLSHAKRCAFINFVTRAAAEQAIQQTFGRLTIHDAIVRVAWARPRKQGPQSELKAGAFGSTAEGAQMPLPPGALNEKVTYASQDPTLLGSASTSGQHK
ncbi:Pre-mRNA-splicing factor slt11 [Tieghemiomyces parasiticus]|uniref:Pre-mRNA-splicing factor SLT11 n=1 Tax=Tieghemiomyces parasiticus TaxID=78921 RepID=A0A9W8A6K9_9FUNG|nr:Pre-mRNA-splicing factor slt11 [Tieghemiomyces parasiticus]